MNSFVVFVLYSLISCCVADEFLCQLFDENAMQFSFFCQPNRGKVPQNCSYENDSTESDEVIHLEIGGCDNDTVFEAIERFKNVRTLDVSYSSYKSLDSLNFLNNKLEAINVSNNKLLEYPWRSYSDFFVRFPELIELDLSHNGINAIHAITNGSVIKLKKFHVSHNGITFIQSNAFVNLTDLEYIDLSYNKLDQLTSNVFSSIQHLSTLHLEHNPIDFFLCSGLLEMKALWAYISWDRLQYFDTDCDGIASSFTNSSDWLSTQFVIALNSSKEGFIPIAENQYKIVCSNRSFESIRTFKAGPDKYMNVLELLQCFGPTLIHLDFSGNYVGSLTPETLEQFTNLQELSLHDTQLLSFDFQMIQHQKQLTALDVSYNNLVNLENIVMAWNLKHLTSFNAAGNKLKSGMIQRLPPSIKYLNISDNGLGELTKKVFHHLKSLEELSVKNTNLVISNADPFGQLEKLYLLDVSFNNLQDCDFTLLSSTLSRLREFRAVECNISSANEVIQHFGPKLWTLDLSGNFVGDVNMDSPLQRLTPLNLRLNNANISHFDLNVLRESIDLVSLEISDNELGDIDLEPLSNYLLELNLENNSLDDIENLNSEHFPRLRSLKIRQNLLSCEYLERLNREWDDKIVGFNPWDQKHGEDCSHTDYNSTSQAEETSATSVGT